MLSSGISTYNCNFVNRSSKMIFGGWCSNNGAVRKYVVDMSSVESGSVAGSQVVFEKMNNNAK